MRLRCPTPPVQERCTGVKAELRELLARHGIKQHRMVPVKRSYAFEVEGVPHGQQYVIKVCRGAGHVLGSCMHAIMHYSCRAACTGA